MSQAKRKETQRPVYVAQDEFDITLADIASKFDALKKQGVRPNFSAVGLAMFRGLRAGKVKVTDLVAEK